MTPAKKRLHSALDIHGMVAYIEHIAPTNPSKEKHVFTISPALMQQCIDMVAKEQDYIPSPDGLEADYCVYNIPGEGVWIVEPWATEGGDYIKAQEIVLTSRL